MSTLIQPASGYMNYPGDVTVSIQERIDSGEPMGPNYLGEPMWPVDVVFNAETNTTSVGFSIISPAVPS